MSFGVGDRTQQWGWWLAGITWAAERVLGNKIQGGVQFIRQVGHSPHLSGLVCSWMADVHWGWDKSQEQSQSEGMMVWACERLPGGQNAWRGEVLQINRSLAGYGLVWPAPEWQRSSGFVSSAQQQGQGQTEMMWTWERDLGNIIQSNNIFKTLKSSMLHLSLKLFRILYWFQINIQIL